MLIYIVEDEERIRNLESYALEKNGFEVMSFADSGGFYQAMDDRAPDLILLDIMLPGDDGLTILKKLRSSSEYDNIPVIIISAKTTELDRVKGLDHGKKDCIQPVLYGHNHRGNRNSHNNHCLLRIFSCGSQGKPCA